MKLGLDFHNVITKYPELFSSLTKTFVALGGEVHVVTGRRVTDEFKKQLEDYGISYTHLFSISDYHHQLGTPMTGYEDGQPKIDIDIWNATKAGYCAEQQIDLHIDDSEVYGKYFTTPYTRFDGDDICNVQDVVREIRNCMTNSIDGLVVLRAQPLHFGHIRLINTALTLCDRVFIVLGSTQESGTSRNPFTFSERKKMLKRYYDLTFWDRIVVIGLKDIFSLRWPAYVLEEIDKAYPYANITKIFGGSQYDCDWFKEQNLEAHIVDRTDESYPFISASMLRDMLTYRDPRWMDHIPRCNWEMVAKKFNQLDLFYAEKEISGRKENILQNFTKNFLEDQVEMPEKYNEVFTDHLKDILA